MQSDPINTKEYLESKLNIKLGPQLTLEEISDSEINVSRFLRDNTPEDSIILTPPNFGVTRTFGKRAIVVDFDAFPYQDVAMKEWRDRLYDLFGKPEVGGFAAYPELRNNFRNIGDKKIMSLKEKYNFDYVVISRKVSTDFPIIFQDTFFYVLKMD